MVTIAFCILQAAVFPLGIQCLFLSFTYQYTSALSQSYKCCITIVFCLFIVLYLSDDVCYMFLLQLIRSFTWICHQHYSNLMSFITVSATTTTLLLLRTSLGIIVVILFSILHTRVLRFAVPVI